MPLLSSKQAADFFHDYLVDYSVVDLLADAASVITSHPCLAISEREDAAKRFQVLAYILLCDPKTQNPRKTNA